MVWIRNLWRTVWTCALGTVIGPMTVFAQPEAVILVPLDEARFEWEAGVGGAPAEEFVVRCGIETQVRTLEAVVPGSLTMTFVKDVVAVPGTYYCAVIGRNPFGESPESNEVRFETGYRPTAPSLTIRVR